MTNGEDEITKWFADQSRAGQGGFPIGIGDDMAQVAVAGGGSVLITTDMLLDGTHFDLAEVSIEQAGYKAMAVSLSDCAAMASVPLCAVVAVGLPAGFGSEELKGLHGGLVRAGEAFDCALIGGDITSWSSEAGRFVINVAMLSRPADHCEPVKRGGAQVGDVICVTGSLGGASAGKHLTFTPRVKEALELTRIAKVNSMIDVSDGLSSDLNRICTQSNVGAEIAAGEVPLSASARKSCSPLESALNDGEDFELLFTLAPGEYDKLTEAWSLETPITKMGKVSGVFGMKIVMPDGSVTVLEAKGYDHL